MQRGAAVNTTSQGGVSSKRIKNEMLMRVTQNNVLESPELSGSPYLPACFIPKNHWAYSLLNAYKVRDLRERAWETAAFQQLQ